MSKSLEMAQKIIEHLEMREARTQQLATAIGALQRRDHKAICDEIANLLDGKPAVSEPPPVATAPAAVPATEKANAGSTKPKEATKPAQA